MGSLTSVETIVLMLAGRMGQSLNQKDLCPWIPGCFGSVALHREVYSTSNNSCVTEPEDRLDFSRCKKIIENENKHRPSDNHQRSK